MTDQDPYLIISSDCHAGLPTEEYRPYLDSRFHRAFDEFLGERGARREEATRLGIRNDAFAAK
ncbi:amidohydrolase, partial [Streptomyces sp. NPDC056983]